VIKISSI